jgi:hypothetical protein
MFLYYHGLYDLTIVGYICNFLPDNRTNIIYDSENKNESKNESKNKNKNKIAKKSHHIINNVERTQLCEQWIFRFIEDGIFSEIITNFDNLVIRNNITFLKKIVKYMNTETIRTLISLKHAMQSRNPDMVEFMFSLIRERRYLSWRYDYSMVVMDAFETGYIPIIENAYETHFTNILSEDLIKIFQKCCSFGRLSQIKRFMSVWKSDLRFARNCK